MAWCSVKAGGQLYLFTVRFIRQYPINFWTFKTQRFLPEGNEEFTHLPEYSAHDTIILYRYKVTD